MTLIIPARHFNKVEVFNNKTQEFMTIRDEISCKETTLNLEHSLLSIRKWECKWHEPFFSDKKLTGEQFIDYIRCMTLNTAVDPNVYLCLLEPDVEKIEEYMQDPQSAWKLTGEKDGKKKKTKYTVEVIYHTMFEAGIPKECEKWHLNSLLALIDYYGYKGGSTNGGGGGRKKKSERELFLAYHDMNMKARAKYNSRG